METQEILDWCISQSLDDGYIIIPEEMFISLDFKAASQIADYFENRILIKLPEREIEFFEWLKENDLPVWNDLWYNPDIEPYLVSISFLPVMIDSTVGFPICDLENLDNYFFMPEMIEGKEAELFLESITKRFKTKGDLTLSQALLLRISLFPTDIWHFAYNYKLPLDSIKEAVKELVDEQMLIHLPSREHIAAFINF